ncbi:MAG: TlpA disulfide reductase family protein [Candidatus Thiodiazotropha sp.]
MHWLAITLLLLFTTAVSGEELWIDDGAGTEFAVHTEAADSDLLVIWFVDHDEPRPPFDDMLAALNRLDVEVWRVDLLAAYFLPRTSETVRTLPGTGVAAVIHAAHQLRTKQILLASYDRMALPLLRGVQLWQQTAADSRLIGAMLFYPNLFGPPPLAGEEPQIDPILHATNIPLVIYQPALGSQRWRLGAVTDALWRGGSATYVYLVPGVRDWFFMGEEDHGPAARTATEALPGQIRRFADLLASHPKPLTAGPVNGSTTARGQIRTLVELDRPGEAPAFSLEAIDGSPYDSGNFRDKVVLLNFWATWCPPCVEELPSLNRLQARYTGSDLRIISVDFRETPQQMADFLERIPVAFPVLMDNTGKVALNWRVFSFPSTFIIDRQGRIRYSANRAIDWDSPEVWKVVDRLLKEQ